MRINLKYSAALLGFLTLALGFAVWISRVTTPVVEYRSYKGSDPTRFDFKRSEAAKMANALPQSLLSRSVAPGELLLLCGETALPEGDLPFMVAEISQRRPDGTRVTANSGLNTIIRKGSREATYSVLLNAPPSVGEFEVEIRWGELYVAHGMLTVR